MILDEKIKEEIRVRKEKKDNFLKKYINSIDLQTIKDIREFYNFPLLSLFRVKKKSGHKISLNKTIEDAGHLLEETLVRLAHHEKSLNECKKLLKETMRLLQESETSRKELLEQQTRSVRLCEETIKDLKKSNRENNFLRSAVKDLVKGE